MEQGSQKTIGLIYFNFLVGHIKVLVALSRNPVNRAAAFFSQTSGAKDLGQTTQAERGRYMGLPTIGGGYSGSRVGIDGDLYLQVIEYGSTIHCNAAYTGNLTGGGAEAELTGYQEVVGSGGNVICRPTRGGQGGR